MKPNYFYLLKGTLYRSPDNPEDLIEIDEVFENDNLIEARERAFEVYQNYLDVLLESRGEQYRSHGFTRLILSCFYKGKKVSTPTKSLLNVMQLDEVKDFDKGLGVYLVSKEAKKYTTLEGEVIYEDKLLIHDLNSDVPNIKAHMYASLRKEYEIYSTNNYDCKHLVILALPMKEEFILKTPIDYKFHRINQLIFEGV